MGSVVIRWARPTPTHKPAMTAAIFEIRQSYGLSRAYPANPTAVALMKLCSTKTLLGYQLEAIQALGFQPVTTDGRAITQADLT